MDAPKPLLRRRLTWVAVTVAAVAAVAAAPVFGPGKLAPDRPVDGGVPPASAPPPGGPPAPPAGPVVLARGTLISHEHETSGSVAVLRLADGSRVLRLEDLRTSDGPALRVWL